MLTAAVMPWRISTNKSQSSSHETKVSLGLIPIEAVGDSRQFVFDFMGQAARRFHFRCQLFERTQTIVARKRGDQTQSRQAVLCFAISPHAPDHTAWNAAEEGQHLPAPQSLAQNRRTLCINDWGGPPYSMPRNEQ